MCLAQIESSARVADPQARETWTRGPITARPPPRRGTLIPIERGVTNEIRRKNRRDFVSLLASSALMIAVMVVIWVVTGAGSFWPMWMIFGLSVVLLGSAWRAFRPQPSRQPHQPDRQFDRG